MGSSLPKGTLTLHNLLTSQPGQVCSYLSS